MRFLLFGEDFLLNASRAFVESSDLSNVIKLPGLTDNAWAVLSAMDIFVLTSRVEGLPNVMIEAQGAGLPVVCTGAGGMFETFIEGETGFGVQPSTPDALAGTVRRLIDDKALRRRMGKNAQRHAREAFGIERMIDLTLDAYREAPEKKRDLVPDWQDVLPTEVRLGGILKVGGHCFTANLPMGVDVSTLELWEDDHLLGPKKSSRSDIREFGFGRYEIDDNRIFFSTSDTSDPRFIGRSYRLRRSDPDHDDIVVRSEVIMPEMGHCYTANLVIGPGSGRFWLMREDGKRLGPGGCLHDDVRLQGSGRYSVWGDYLYFSASDNSDPRTNQRAYILRRGKATAAPSDHADAFASATLDEVMRYLVRSATPRDDYVPGRVVHVGGSMGPGGAERQITYTFTSGACPEISR